MFSSLLNKIDFARKIIINFFFILIILSIIIGLFIFPFINDNNLDIKGSILTINTNDISEKAVSYLNSDNNLNTYQVIEAIDIASFDDDVKLLFLDLSFLNISPATAYEVGNAIKHFREKEKRVIVYGDFLNQSQYLLASFGDEIIINPLGMVYLEGFKKYQIYLKDFLENNKINVNTFVAGDYKSAIEIFSNSGMSELDKQQSKSFLSDLWKNWVIEITKNRESLSIDINYFINSFNIIDPNLSAAEKAKKYGFVDKILNKVELRNYLLSLDEVEENIFSGSPKFLNLDTYYENKKIISQEDERIVVLNAYGEIVDGSFQENQIASRFFSKQINKISKDKSIKGVLLRVNSPGGSGFASEVIRQEILNLKSTGIPIIVSISDIAASGGYWISANVTEIWANPLSITGSIGVFAILPSFEETLSKYGINYDGVSTSNFNPSVVSNPSDNLKIFIQSYVDRAYSDFISLVSDGRNLNKDKVKEIANGKVWTGSQALKNGLIDNIGTQKEAISRLKEIIGNDNLKVELIDFEQNLFDFLRSAFLNFKVNFKFFSNTYNLKDIVFEDLSLNANRLIDLRLDCIKCSIK